ncbi:hypothetical protein ACF1BQ_012750 [Bradyrhizobium sp. RDT10]
MAQAAVALLGFVAILFQINEIRTNNRATSARQAFLGYTDLAFKNPKFAQPDYEKIKAAGGDEQVQYESLSPTSSTPARKRSARSRESASGSRPAITT